MNMLNYLWPRLPKLIRLWTRHTIEGDPKKSFETVVQLSEHLSFRENEFEEYLANLKERDLDAHARLLNIKLERLPPVAELLDYPEGSLGRELGAFLKRNKITPESFPREINNSLEERLKAHLYEFHDAWHVVTGFGADDEGELALQAFSLGQDHEDLFALSILSSGIAGILLRRPWRVPSLMRLIKEGYQLGRRAKQFVGQPWIDWLGRPLDDVRRELGVSV
jgi:ubiquinone biosynthesis protein Coq4